MLNGVYVQRTPMALAGKPHPMRIMIKEKPKARRVPATQEGRIGFTKMSKNLLNAHYALIADQ